MFKTHVGTLASALYELESGMSIFQTLSFCTTILQSILTFVSEAISVLTSAKFATPAMLIGGGSVVFYFLLVLCIV